MSLAALFTESPTTAYSLLERLPTHPQKTWDKKGEEEVMC